MEYRPGQLVGRHELVAPLGAGSMGEVWEAILHGPQGFEKPVALKLIVGGEVLRGALIREARLGALLHHPNVVGIYELGSAGGIWFVAMELVRGPTVAALARSRPLPASAVLEVGLQAAAGLAHIHALRLGDRPAGLVHRDVKPSNLLVDGTGLVKVADLGLAAVADVRSPAVQGGTPPYLAPEQARGHHDHRSDVWALGVVLYELAARERPFGGGLDAVQRARHVEDRLVEPSFLRPVDDGVPGLGEVLYRCLRLDPERRWSGMEELGSALAVLRSRSAGESLGDLLGRSSLGSPRIVDLRAPDSSPTVAVVDGNLPDARDRFHGRAQEVRTLADLLSGDERLVTLCGFGGVGKTRLALETGRACGGSFAGGVWLADLSECRTEADVCSGLARVLGVEPGMGSDGPIVADALRSRGAVLVVLDNLEQVRAPAVALLTRWLETAPLATFLCTSRVPLGIRGERLVPVGPLGVEAATALFLDRAVVAAPPEHHADVRQLVQALEGVPLAIELAAARTRVLAVPAIARRLDDRLRLLAGGDDRYPERHRSLVASIGWSWELLDPWARAALVQLAVFEGGFTLEAAESVLDLTLFTGVFWAIDVLQALVDTSLLRVEPVAGRFSMLAAVHDFAVERASPEDLADAEVRHARHFATLEPGPPEAAADEIDNLDAAIRRAVARGDGAVAGPLALAAMLVYERQGPLRQGTERMAAVADLPGLDPRRRVTILAWCGRHQVLIGLGAVGRANVERGLAEARAMGLANEEVQLLVALGSIQTTLGEVDAALATYDLALSRPLGGPGLEGRIRQNQANALQSLGRGEEARAAYVRAIALLERDGKSLRSLVLARSNLGALHQENGDPAGAKDQLARALDEAVAVGHQRLEATIRGNLGQVLTELGERAEARRMLERALETHRKMGNRRSEAFVLANLGGLSQREGEHDRARDFHERALALAREIGLRRLEGGVLCEMARGRVLAGVPAEAPALLDRAEEILREVGARNELARVEGLEGPVVSQMLPLRSRP